MWAAGITSKHAVAALAFAMALAACGGTSESGSDPQRTVASSATAPTACGATGVDAVLPQVGYLKTVTLFYATQASGSFTSASGACPLSELGGEAAPASAIVVQNTSGRAGYLEANAECMATDEAFLAVYAGATAAPASDAERMACTGRVASGCPSLTVANAGAVMLAPCETAVVVIQGASSSSSRPMALDLDLAATTAAQ